jgi:hypothetical protein
MKNVDPLKSKIMKLTYTRKVAFNINGQHFALAIPLINNHINSKH